MTTIHDVPNERRDAARGEREIGDLFERVIAQCLRADPEYANQFNDAWMWMDWPDRDGAQDAGIDAVGQDCCIASFRHVRLSKVTRGKQTCASNAHQTCKSDQIKTAERILRGQGWRALSGCGKKHWCFSQKNAYSSVGA